MSESRSVKLDSYREYPPAEMLQRAIDFHSEMQRRRTVREFDARPVPAAVIEACVRAAGTAPSGANQQPWRFVAVSNPGVRRRIREAAEREEQAFYTRRAPAAWLEAIAPLGTDARKPYLEVAPWLIAVFALRHGTGPRGGRVKHYYPNESVGIAVGMLLTALHHAGLVALTHTPSPMKFLNGILGRPAAERPFVLVVTGYPAPDARVPAISRKPLEDILTVLA